MRTYKIEGIILKRTNLGEAERLVSVFSKQHGKIRVRAPGVRKIISRKAAHLELFNHSLLMLVQGKNLDIITEAETINNFSRIRKNFNQVATAYYFCELVERLLPERQENQEIFELLKESLEKLGNISDLSGLGRLGESFSNRLLQILGYLEKKNFLTGENLERYLENVMERKIKSKKMLDKTQRM